MSSKKAFSSGADLGNKHERISQCTCVERRTKGRKEYKCLRVQTTNVNVRLVLDEILGYADVPENVYNARQQ